MKKNGKYMQQITAEIAIEHDNMYRELLPEIGAAMYNFDPYEARDTNDFNTDNPYADTINQLENDYVNMFQVMGCFIKYCDDYKDDLVMDEESEALLDKVCVAYASAYSKKGHLYEDNVMLSKQSDWTKQISGVVTERLDKVSNGDFKKEMANALENATTVKDMRRVFKYSDKLMDKYPDLRDAKSVKRYYNSIAETKGIQISSRGHEFDDLLRVESDERQYN